MLGMYASHEATKEAAFQAAAKAEVAKLGVNGPVRVGAVETYLRGVVGDELAGAMRTMMVSEKIVRGFESLITKSSSQGAAAFSQSHREPGDRPGRVSDEQYNSMSQSERWAYMREHNQRQFSNNGGR